MSENKQWSPARVAASKVSTFSKTRLVIKFETPGEEKVSPILSGVMIVGGVGMMIAQKVKVLL